MSALPPLPPLPPLSVGKAARTEVLRRYEDATRCLDRTLEAQAVVAAEMLQLRRDIAACVEWLWPRQRWGAPRRPRRPHGVGPPPIPPPPADPDPLWGRRLRSAALAVLLHNRGRPMSLPEIHTALHLRGFVVVSHYPVKALADAMGYEARRGRAIRPRRGYYQLGVLSPGQRRRLARVQADQTPAGALPEAAEQGARATGRRPLWTVAPPAPGGATDGRWSAWLPRGASRASNGQRERVWCAIEESGPATCSCERLRDPPPGPLTSTAPARAPSACAGCSGPVGVEQPP